MANVYINDYVEAGPLPLGGVKLFMLTGKAAKLKVAAGYLGAFGGDGEDPLDPLLVPAASLSVLLAHGSIVHDTDCNRSPLDSRMTAAQLDNVFGALAGNVGSEEAPDMLDLDEPWPYGALEAELGRRRDVLISKSSHAAITLDPLAFTDLDAGGAMNDIPAFMLPGLRWRMGSIAVENSGALGAYAELLYFAPELYDVGCLHDANLVSVQALRRLGSSFMRFMNDRSGDPDMLDDMSDAELGLSFRDFLLRLRAPVALRSFLAPDLGRLVQLTGLLLRLRGISQNVSGSPTAMHARAPAALRAPRGPRAPCALSAPRFARPV